MQRIVVVAAVVVAVALCVQAAPSSFTGVTETIEDLGDGTVRTTLRLSANRRPQPDCPPTGPFTNILVPMINWCVNPVTTVNASLSNGYWIQPPLAQPLASFRTEPLSFGIRARHEDFSDLIQGKFEITGFLPDGVTPWPKSIKVAFLFQGVGGTFTMTSWRPLNVKGHVTYYGEAISVRIAVGHDDWRIPLPGTPPC